LTLGVGIFLLTVFAPRIASAQRPQLTVVLHDCGSMRQDDVARLLAIELAAVAEPGRRMPTLGVEITCAGGVVRIEVKDPLTDKRVEREIPAPPASEPGAERVVALAASQLFVASWLELLVEQDTPASNAPEAAPARRAARRLVQTRIAAPSPVVAVEFEADTRVRDLSEAFWTFGGGARGGLRLSPRWTAFGQTRFEAGRAQRSIGAVDLRAFFLGAGTTLQWLRFGPLSVDARAGLSGGWMGLRGHARAGQADPGATDSFTAEIALGLGPTWHAGSVDVGVDFEIGAMLRTPLGLVGGGEPDVSPGGPWAGASLRVGTAVP